MSSRFARRAGVSAPVAAFVVAAVIVIVIAGVLFATGGSTTTTSGGSASSSTVTSSTTSQTVSSTASSQTSASSASSGGLSSLLLQLSVNSTSFAQGQNVGINVSEFNRATAPANYSAMNSWPRPDLAVGPCGTAGSAFGIAIFQGHYTSQNASSAVALRIFPTSSCSVVIKEPTWYLFQGQSDVATNSLGGIPATMAASISVNGTWSGGDIRGVGATLTNLPAGSYTVVAGDQWGRLVFQYFSVTA